MQSEYISFYHKAVNTKMKDDEEVNCMDDIFRNVISFNCLQY